MWLLSRGWRLNIVFADVLTISAITGCRLCLKSSVHVYSQPLMLWCLWTQDCVSSDCLQVMKDAVSVCACFRRHHMTQGLELLQVQKPAV